MAENAEVGAAGEGADGEGEAEVGSTGGGKARMIVAVVVTLLCLGVGGAVGGTTLGSTVGPILADKAMAASDGGGDGRGEGGGEGGTALLHLIDNLVVNPARSQGTRFLLTSIAVEVNAPEMVDVLAERDVAIRDALIIVLGAKSVEELTDITLRRQIAQEVHDAIVIVVGPDLVHKIYIPQFVIQ